MFGWLGVGVGKAVLEGRASSTPTSAPKDFLVAWAGGWVGVTRQTRDRANRLPGKPPTLTPATASLPMPGVTPQSNPTHPPQLTLPWSTGHATLPRLFPPHPPLRAPPSERRRDHPGGWVGMRGAANRPIRFRSGQAARMGGRVVGWVGRRVVGMSAVVGGIPFGMPPVRLSPDATPWGEPGNPRLISHGGPSATPAEGHSQTLPSIHSPAPPFCQLMPGSVPPGGS